MNNNIDTKRLDGLSMDLEKANKEKLKLVFPECFVEDKLDIDKLLGLCGEYIIEVFEKYSFEWKGKSECLQLAQKRSSGALRLYPEESVDFQNTKNIYIEGDNLEVLKLLQIAYFNKVKMIYLDPPYNTGHDFVYEDDYSDPLERYKAVTSQATKSNPETMGRFHTKWLNMMYPRLRLAANLLKDDGVIFISIDDSEVHNLRKLCDETFGEENFIAQFTWKRRSGANDAKNNVSLDHEYVMCYGKYMTTSLTGIVKEFENYSNPDNDPRGDWVRGDLTCGKTASQRPNLYYSITDPKTGIEYACNPNHVWRFEKNKMNELIKNGKVLFPSDGKGLPAYKRHREEVRSDTKPFSSIIDTKLNLVATKELRDILKGQLFDYPKTVDLIKQLIYQGTSSDNEDIILDFFSGSATTAHAVMQLNAEDGGNRQFILVQLPELCDEKSEAYKAGYKNICEIGKERIRRAGKKITEENNQLKLEERETPLDVGFKVFKLDTSNLNQWDTTPVNDNITLFNQRVLDYNSGIKKDRSDLDVIYELILKMGIPLDISVIPLDINGKKAYSIREDCLMLACFENDITLDDIREMIKYLPIMLIVSEKGFKDDTTLVNVHYIIKDKEIELKLV